MDIEDLKQIAARSRVPALLNSMGLWLPALGVVRRVVQAGRALANDQARLFSRVINEDYERCRDQLERIARGAPLCADGKSALMISTFPTVWATKLEAILSLALRMEGFAIYVGDTGNRSLRRYHEACGNTRFLDIEASSLLEPLRPAESICNDNGHNPITVQDLMTLTYRRVDVGRIVLSNVMYRHKFEQLDLSRSTMQHEVFRELELVERNVRSAERLLDSARPSIAFVIEKGLTPSAEIVGACWARGVPVVQYVNSQLTNAFVFKRFTADNRQTHPFSLNLETWERVKQMPWTQEREEELMKELENGYKLGTWFARKFVHANKKIKSPAEVAAQLELDPAKKTAVIFSHVLWDATFFYGKGLFPDYETWLLESIRAACANSRVNWIVKLHPDLVWKLKYEHYTDELRDVIAVRSAVGELPDHVKLVMPEIDINTFSFFGVTDYCITVRGTIGIEMSCYGVPVITAGTGRYSNLGFTVDSATRDEYLDRLAGVQDIPPMTRDQVTLARRFAYALFKLRPWPLQSFEMVRQPVEVTGDPLDHNLLLRVEDFAEFAAARDMRRFRRWLVSGEPDYLQDNAETIG